MTKPASSIAFRQYVRLPLLGAAFVEREDDRPSVLPFFAWDTDRADDGQGSVLGFTLRAGRWVVVVDRPAAEVQGRVSCAWPAGAPYSVARPSATAAWIALGAPLVTLAGIAACLLGSPARHALASLQGRPVRS